MTQATINVRMDAGLKAKFNEFCEQTGMTMSTAVTMFARDTVRNQALPFAVTTRRRQAEDPFWSATNQQRLRKSIVEMEETGGVIHEIQAYD